MTATTTRLHIERLGQRGEGIARHGDGLVAVPYALAGETVLAEIVGDRGRLVDVIEPDPSRIPPHCPYYGRCGGCAVQTLAPEAYAQWKRQLVSDALRRAGLEAEVAPLADAHGEGRRRVVFHARYDARGRPTVGFMEARTHRVVAIETCPLFAPSLDEAVGVARALATALGKSAKPFDIHVTATDTGLDVDLRGLGPLDDVTRQALVRQALARDLARLSNHGEIILMQREPLLGMGRARVAPPPGAFLQATRAGEELLVAAARAALAGARRIADLFAGVGTFTLRLAEEARVHAVDCEAAALSALAEAARSAGLKPVEVETRDLFRRPLTTDELAPYDAVLFDPPRLGAEHQARALAAANVPRIVAVSCHAPSFARDAALLRDGGYVLGTVAPIDQFRHTPHVEIVATFRRDPGKSQRKRRLLG